MVGSEIPQIPVTGTYLTLYTSIIPISTLSSGSTGKRFRFLCNVGSAIVDGQHGQQYRHNAVSYALAVVLQQ